MHRCPPLRASGLLVAGLLASSVAQAASLQAVNNWGATGVPSYVSMYIYVPDKVATNPPILVVSHFCGGSASAVFGQAQTGGIVKAADMYGFIMIFPQTTNAATSAKCWEVGSTKSLTHDGGGDTQAVAQMVKYAVTTYKANANRVYATGDSSGGMMTEALLAVYPDVFKGGSSFAGVPAGCWSAGWSAASNWGGTCAGGNYTQTAQQWGDKVRAMFPGYSGSRPRVQLVHGDADPTISYKNQTEGVKEWTNVLGLAMAPTATETGLTLGSHKATRDRWQSACGSVVLETITSIGGDHGPSDALFNSSYVIPFLGLDKTGDVDPVVASCSGDAGAGGAVGPPGSGGRGGGSVDAGAPGGAGGNSHDGGTSDGSGSGGAPPGSGGASGTGGIADAGEPAGSGGTSSTGGTTASGGSSGSGGLVGSGGNSGSGGAASGGSATGGTTSAGSGGTSGSGGAGETPGDTAPAGCACGVGGSRSGMPCDADLAGLLGLTLAIVVRRRKQESSR